MINTRAFLQLHAEVVGRRLPKQCLAATGRAVEQEAFRNVMLELLEQVRMKKRHFDGVANRLHRFLLPADVDPREFSD